MGSHAAQSRAQGALPGRRILIFVTVGNSHYGFPRLVKAMDALAPALPLPVFIQLGCDSTRPINAQWAAFLTYEAMMERMAEAALVVGHASAGPILHARRLGRPLIVVPRKPELGEHLDGHQVETGRAVEGMPGIDVAWEVGILPERIPAVLADPAIQFAGRTRMEGLDSLIAGIRGWLDGVAAAKAHV